MYTEGDKTVAAEPKCGQSTFVEAIRGQPKPLLGGLLALSNPTIAKITTQAGLDWRLIDAEHSTYMPAQVTELVHAAYGAADGNCCLPVVRIPSHGAEYIKRSLDSGPVGILVPMVQTAVELEAIIEQVLYPPAGSAASGHTMPNLQTCTLAASLTTTPKRSGGKLHSFAVFESRDAINNAEEIP
jgi:2-keto-3-deoxy-L-rhamnonate aldolase RhmA